jgi:hypothetical protein
MSGGCYCGYVRYATDGTPSDETSCHCSVCRRVSGAPFVAWFTVPVAALRFTAGEPVLFRSSEHGTRSFCPRCGTPLTFQSSRLHELPALGGSARRRPALLSRAPGLTSEVPRGRTTRATAGA